MEKEDSRGLVTVLENGEKKELQIVDFIQARYKDNRLITLSTLEDETIIIVVENPLSSGRANQVMMRLTKESYIGVLNTMMMFGTVKNFDYRSEMEKTVNEDLVHYSYSDNLPDLLDVIGTNISES